MLHTVFIIIFFTKHKHYHGVRLVVKSREEFTVIKLTHNNNNAGKFKEEFIAFQEAFREDFEYSDFFRDHQLRPQHIGNIRREYTQLWTQIRT